MAYNDAEIRFRASLEDNVSPQADKLEKKLRQMGATPAEIKMMLRAYDEATPKIKEVQKHVDQLNKQGLIRLRADTSQAHSEIKRVRAEAERPIKLTFLDNLKETTDRLFSLRNNMNTNLGGLNIRGLGAGAGITGLVAGAAGVVQQGISVQSEREQSMVTLSQTLKDNTQAQQEMGKLIKTAQTTPFNYADVLKADVRLRSYQIPSMPGEGGPGNQGYLKSAGDMAAAMNTPITQAVEAIADARQGYFVRMMSYGIRMMREDFSTGGKYAGQTYEQGLEKALRRFEGAQEMQSHTFKGIMSNLQDILQNQIIAPIGAAPFQAAKAGAESLQNKLNSPDFQRELGKEIEKVQHGFVNLFDTIQQGKQYFQDNLQQPLMDLGKMIVTVGSTFIKAFGAPLIAALKTVGELFNIIVKPIATLIGGHPQLVQLYATFKALSMLGFTGPSQGLAKIGAALNPLHPSIFKLVSGVQQLSSGLMKVGIALIVKGFIDAKASADNLRNSLKHVGVAGDDFDKLNAKIANMANGLGQSAGNMKNLVAEAAKGQNMSAGNAIQQARHAAVLDRDYGIKANDANKMITDQIAYLLKENPQAKNNMSLTENAAAASIRDLKIAADALNMSFKDVQRVMSQFGSEGQKVGLGGAVGGRYLAAMADATHDPRFKLSQEQLNQGLTSGDSVMHALLNQYHEPGIDQMRSIGNVNKFYDFKGGSPAIARRFVPSAMYGNTVGAGPVASVAAPGDAENPAQKATRQIQQLGDIVGTVRAQVRDAQRQQDYLNKVGGGVTRMPNMVFQQPAEKGLESTVAGIFKAQNPEQQAEQLRRAAIKADDALKGNLDQVAKLNTVINRYNKELNTLSVGQQQLSLSQMRLQRSWVADQRQIEDLSLAVAKYTQANLAPLQREMNRVAQASAELGNKMSNAQYGMSKFAGGLLEGEQAALNQLHAMERYQRQLNILQLTYQTIGGQLGAEVFDQGAKVRVTPLSNFALQSQMERNQRKADLARLKQEDTFGEGHYQMDQAARSRIARTEMPLADRLKGIKDNQRVIDDVTQAQHNMENVQFRLGTKMFKVNENIQDQQGHIQDLTLALQDKQLHGGMRDLEDRQARIADKTARVNIQLTRYNAQMAQVQASVDNLKDMKQIFRDWYLSMIDFSSIKQPEIFDRIIEFGKSAGTLTKGQIKILQEAKHNVEVALKKEGAGKWVEDKPSWIEVIKRGVAGLVSGESWRTLSDNIKATGHKLDKIIPGAGALGDIAGSTPIAAMLTAISGGTAFLVLTALAGNIVKQLAVRPIAGLIGSHLPNVLQNSERAGRWGGALTDFAAGGSWRQAVTEPFRLSTRARTWLGRGVGAAIGTAVSPGMGTLAGGWAGGNFANRGTIREWLTHPIETFKKASGESLKAATKFVPGADHVVDASKRIKNAAHSNVIIADKHGRIVKDFATSNEHFNEHVKSFRSRIGSFGSKVASFAEENKTHAGRMAKVAVAFAAAVELFKNVGGWIANALGHGKEYARDAGGAARAGGAVNTARERARNWRTRRRNEGGAGGPLSRAEARRQLEGVVDPAEYKHFADLAKKEHVDITNPQSRSARALAGRFLRGIGVAGDAMFVTDILRGSAGGNRTDQAAAGAGAAGAAVAARRAMAAGLKQGLTGGELRSFILKNAGRGALPILGNVMMAKSLWDVMEGETGLDARERVSETASRIPIQYREAFLRGQAMHGKGGIAGVAKTQLQNFRVNHTRAEIERATMSIVEDGDTPAKRRRLKDLQNQLDDLLGQQKDSEAKSKKSAKDNQADKRADRTDHHQKVLKITNDAIARMSTLTDKANTDSRKSLQTHLNNMTTDTDKGFGAIGTTTGTWLDGIVKSIDKFKKDLGISTDKHESTPSTGLTTAMHGGLRPFAGGGIPQHHIIKGMKDGKGRLYRAGEEGDEVIIPLVPHRRQRAINLARMTLGRLGASDHHMAPKHHANGGSVDRAYVVARNAYHQASDSFANGGFSLRSQVALRGVHPQVLAAAQAIEKAFPGITITSGAGGRHAGASLHYIGDAVDLGGSAADMQRASEWIKRSGLASKLAEGIHNPNLSIKNGRTVPASFWGASTWAGHANHIHLGITAGDIGHLAGVDLKNLGSLTGPKLARVPASLKLMGAIGRDVHTALSKLRKTARAHASMFGGGEIPGGSFHGGGNATANIALGQRMAAAMGWKGSQWNALKQLWIGESGWDHHATNPTSGAYGIPQSLPASKMAAAGADWMTNPATQIAWGMNYIKQTPGYGNPISTLAKWTARSPHWYHNPNAVSQVHHEQMARLEPGNVVLGKRIGAIAQAASTSGSPETTKKVIPTIEDIQAHIKKVEKHLAHANDREDRKKDQADLRSLNAELRSRWSAQGRSDKAADKSTQRMIRLGGDTTDGEATLAGVKAEIAKFNKIVDQAAKNDQRRVTVANNMVKSAQSLAKTAHTPTQKRLAARAVSSTRKAQTAAKKVTAFTRTKRGQAASRELARGSYTVSAARRGVNARLIKDVTGKALTARQSTAYKRVQTARGKVQTDRTKGRSTTADTKLLNKRLGELRTAMGKGLSSNAKHLQALRTSATKRSTQARKDLKAAAASQGKHINSAGKLVGRVSARTASAVHAHASSSKVRHATSLKSSAERTGKVIAHASGRHKDTIKTAKDVGDKQRGELKGVHGETKEGRKVAQHADKKREDAERNADKREREYQKNSLKLLRDIADRDLSVNVHNQAHGASLSSTIIKAKFKAR